MNLIDLQKKLIGAARGRRPNDHVPYAFEKRIIARLVSQPVADVWLVWSRGLWRAVAPCVGVMVLLAAWTFFTPVQPPAKGMGNLSQDFENTMFAAVDQDNGNTSW
ncbi:MAG TPA: hypothetical protein VH255_10200 [Verrucomicrobiae bacterium]|jgi:hypothetical protein|nr:hypothetical protein [Verrucomicrobiae bacterium]